MISRDGLTTKQLDEFLAQHGCALSDDMRGRLARELLSMKGVENQISENLLNPAMGQVASAVVSAGYDAIVDSSSAQYALSEHFADQYIAGMEVVKEVLSLLKAQASMDLFQGNIRAKRLYESIVAAGVNEVLYNNRRVQR